MSSKKMVVFAAEEMVQRAMWFMDDLYITQEPGGSFSHAGTYNFDVIGYKDHRDIYAPFDCVVKKIHAGESYHNMVIIESAEKVLYADGTYEYMSMAFAHDNDIADLYVGRKIKQGEVFYQTGDYGNSTGVHCHVTCIRGKYKNDMWTKNAEGKYCSLNAICPTKALFVSKKTNVIDTKGLNFKSTTQNKVDKKQIKGAESNKSGTLGKNGGFKWNYNEKTAILTITGSDTGLNGDKTKSSPIKDLNLGTIKKVVFKNCKFKGSLAYLLDFCGSVETVKFQKCDTSKVTNMYRMFFCCSNLKSLDLSGFKTSKVKNMSGMFAGCDSLTKLDLSSFNTSSVTNMAYMFNCRNLKTLNVSGFKTSKVTNMSEMFNGCSSLTSLNLSKWDMSKVKDVNSFFYGCDSLKTLYTPKKMNKKISIELPKKFSDGNGKKYSKITYKHLKKFWFTKCNYSIKFVGNGATSGKMKALTKRSYGKTYTLTKNTYKKKGYKFVGWNTKADGSGTWYKNKAKVKNLTKTDGKTIKLYAQWKKVK